MGWEEQCKVALEMAFSVGRTNGQGSDRRRGQSGHPYSTGNISNAHGYREAEGKVKEKVLVWREEGGWRNSKSQPERKSKPTVWRVWVHFGRNGGPLEVSKQLGDTMKE